MDLKKYRERIGYSGPLRPDRATLDALIKAQLRMVAFENLDQQMGVPVSNSLISTYDKVVLRRRGGWCFELNTLFQWALRKIGFEVSALAGFVGQDKPTKNQKPDHMLLKVDCDGPLLVDVGFGGGMSASVPLLPGAILQQPYRIALTNERGGFIRYSERLSDTETGFWFTLENVEASVFEPASRNLQTDPNSPFLRTLTAQRRYPGKHVILRGLVKKTIDAESIHEEILSSSQALVDCLKGDFDLTVPEIAACWTKLKQRHQDLFTG
ncbi:arylamine N-acetyltransferase family protein [Ruegeria halocynthiae]|uniref:arylamine N-acetyltransferase family protein n=1 Tax=Ruegeria halocynthiae TaxID=985054 RepID=UPI00068E4CDE|nr:arylamine N-acetyltransferase [Ruegeria halocynthiae]